jgi:hypothetical protein
MTDIIPVSDLLPCPFCGGEADIFTPSFPMAADCDDIYVRCGQCDAMGPQVLFDQDTHDADDLGALTAEAVKGWNTRPLSTDKERLIEALDRLYDLADGFSVSGVYFSDACFTDNVAALKAAADALQDHQS